MYIIVSALAMYKESKIRCELARVCHCVPLRICSNR
jgi:hypothetical protein